MIVLFEEPEAWSLMMLASAVALDNADLSAEGKDAVRRWRSEHGEATAAMAKLTDDLNKAMNAHIDTKFLRRIKQTGGRAETVRK